MAVCGPFYYQWEKVLNVETHLLKIDPCVDLPLKNGAVNELHDPDANLPQSSDRKRLILIVPGNPGIVQFYEEFAVALWEDLGRTTPVWGISHAGHVFHDKLHQELFDGQTYPSLQFQIDHKRAFIENHIPAEIEEIIVISHSIGAYTSLRAAQQMPTNPRLVHVIGLFPTLERMSITPQGRVVTPIIRYGRWLFFLVAAVVSWLPKWGKIKFFDFFMPELTGHLQTAVMNLAYLPCARNCFLMTENEMHEVVELDRRLLEAGDRRVTLYYGRDDHWVPVEYYTDVRKAFPDGDFHLCGKGYKHAFVVKDVAPMAELVAGWINGAKKPMAN